MGVASDPYIERFFLSLEEDSELSDEKDGENKPIGGRRSSSMGFSTASLASYIKSTNRAADGKNRQFGRVELEVKRPSCAGSRR